MGKRFLYSLGVCIVLWAFCSLIAQGLQSYTNDRVRSKLIDVRNALVPVVEAMDSLSVEANDAFQQQRIGLSQSEQQLLQFRLSANLMSKFSNMAQQRIRDLCLINPAGGTVPDTVIVVESSKKVEQTYGDYGGWVFNLATWEVWSNIALSD